MDPFELLKQDHKKVSQLFEQIESASEKAKRNLFRELKSELDVHAHIEEAIFYPALENKPESRDITLEAYEEHKVVKDLLAELEAAKTIDGEWDAKLKVLQENVEHHVEEEEGELFNKAEDVLSDAQLESLGMQMQTEKNRQTGGTSRAPETDRSEERESPGVLKRLANLVGFGKSSGKKKTAKKPSRPAKKKAAAKTSAARTGSKKSTRSRAAKTASKGSRKGPKARGTAKKGAAKKPTARAGGKAKRTAKKR